MRKSRICHSIVLSYELRALAVVAQGGGAELCCNNYGVLPEGRSERGRRGRERGVGVLGGKWEEWEGVKGYNGGFCRTSRRRKQQEFV